MCMCVCVCVYVPYKIPASWGINIPVEILLVVIED
jgi:hypothetical protein